jgi:very-short-patch-repair endonuclease
VLVAILKTKADFAILQERGWYRIPVKNAPQRFPPRWLAFYQPQAFQDDPFRVRYFGEVASIDTVKRRELFPNEIESARSDSEYYRIHLKSLQERPNPILSLRWRRIVFIATTWDKFCRAEQINDLFDESPLEDLFWARLKQLAIQAERQFPVWAKNYLYHLDFAFFCRDGRLNVETDGDTWHTAKDRIAADNQRDNTLNQQRWNVLRFNGKQIREELDTYCIGAVLETVNALGGLSDDGLAPRIFYPNGGSVAQQLALFDLPSDYDADDAGLEIED